MPYDHGGKAGQIARARADAVALGQDPDVAAIAAGGVEPMHVTISPRLAELAVNMTHARTLTEAQAVSGVPSNMAGQELVHSMRPIVHALGRRKVNADWVAKRLKRIANLAFTRAEKDEAKAADVLAAIQAVKAIARMRGDLMSDRPEMPGPPPLPSQLIAHVTLVLQELNPQRLPAMDITPSPDAIATAYAHAQGDNHKTDTL